MNRVSLNLTYFLGLQGINCGRALVFACVPSMQKSIKLIQLAQESFVLIRLLIELRSRV